MVCYVLKRVKTTCSMRLYKISLRNSLANVGWVSKTSHNVLRIVLNRFRMFFINQVFWYYSQSLGFKRISLRTTAAYAWLGLCHASSICPWPHHKRNRDQTNRSRPDIRCWTSSWFALTLVLGEGFYSMTGTNVAVTTKLRLKWCFRFDCGR